MTKTIGSVPARTINILPNTTPYRLRGDCATDVTGTSGSPNKTGSIGSVYRDHAAPSRGRIDNPATISTAAIPAFQHRDCFIASLLRGRDPVRSNTRARSRGSRRKKKRPTAAKNNRYRRVAEEKVSSDEGRPPRCHSEPAQPASEKP